MKNTSLAALRKYRGINQTDLAKAVGASRASVIRWESGSVKPGAESLLKLAKVLCAQVTIKGDVIVFEAEELADVDLGVTDYMWAYDMVHAELGADGSWVIHHDNAPDGCLVTSYAEAASMGHDALAQEIRKATS